MTETKGKGKRKGRDGESGKAKRQRYTLDITRGIRAYICTCDQGKEEASAREMIAWLDEAADKYYPRTDNNQSFDSDDDDDEPTANVSVADALKAEIAELKQHKTKKITDGGDRFKSVDSGTRGVAFIHGRDKSFDPAELMRLMYTDALASSRIQTRFTIRVQVVHRTCFARTEELLEIAKTVIDAQFNDTKSSDLTYSVIVSKRSHNADMSSQTMIPAIARLVPRRFKVDLNKPDAAIVIQVLNRMAGIGVMWDFEKLMKYHIRKVGEQKHKSRYDNVKSTDQSKSKAVPADVKPSLEQATPEQTSDASSEQSKVVVEPSVASTDATSTDATSTEAAVATTSKA